MFAETSRQDTRGNSNRVSYVLSQAFDEHAYKSIINRLQRESRVQLDPAYKQDVLRHVRSQYRKRQYPEETYEDWIVGKISTDVKLRKLEKEQDGPHPDQDISDTCRIEYKDFNDQVFDSFASQLISAKKHEQFEEEEIAQLRADVRNGRGDRKTDPSQEADGPNQESISASGDHSNSSSSDFYVTASEDDFENDKQSDAGGANSGELSDGEAGAENQVSQARALLKQWEVIWNTRQEKRREYFTIQQAGLDPNMSLQSKSVKQQHCKSLRTLLHLAIMDQKWDLAYKLYSVLIKIRGINKRLIWMLGAEILQGKLSEAKATMSENSLSGARAVRLCSKMLQDFLSWLSTSFSLGYWSVSRETVNGQPFIGYSKSHAPAYVTSLIWELLSEKAYSKVRDVLEELLLKPPFSTHGLFHYMLAVCCLSENLDIGRISQKFDEITEIMEQDPTTSEYGDLVSDMTLLSSKDSLAARMSHNAKQAQTLLDECDTLEFEYPKEIFLVMLKESLDCGTGGFPSAKRQEESDAADLRLALQNGIVSATNNSNFAVPKTLLLKSNIVDKSDSWILAFYDGEKQLTCKLCNTEFSLESINTLGIHLKTHGIGSENYTTHGTYTAMLHGHESSATDLDSQLESQSDSLSESEMDSDSDLEIPNTADSNSEPYVNGKLPLTSETLANSATRVSTPQSPALKVSLPATNQSDVVAPESTTLENDEPEIPAPQNTCSEVAVETTSKSGLSEENTGEMMSSNGMGSEMALPGTTLSDMSAKMSPNNGISVKSEKIDDFPSHPDSPQQMELTPDLPTTMTEDAQTNNLETATVPFTTGQHTTEDQNRNKTPSQDKEAPRQRNEEFSVAEINQAPADSLPFVPAPEPQNDTRVQVTGDPAEESDASGSEYSAESFVIKLEDEHIEPESDIHQHQQQPPIHEQNGDLSPAAFEDPDGSSPDTSRFPFSLHDTMLPVQLGGSGNYRKPVASNTTETSFLAHTQILGSLLENSAGDLSDVDHDGISATKHISDESPQPQDSLRVKDEEDTAPENAFNSFSPDSTFDNHDYDRDVSQNFHELATQTHHDYFPTKNTSVHHEEDDLDANLAIPEIKYEDDEYGYEDYENEDFTNMEANIDHIGQKDTWSDEYEENSEEEGRWWDTYGISKAAEDMVADDSDSDYQSASDDASDISDESDF